MHSGFEVAPDGAKLLLFESYDPSLNDVILVIYTDFTDLNAVQQLAKLANISPRVGSCDPQKQCSSFAGFTFIIAAPR